MKLAQFYSTLTLLEWVPSPVNNNLWEIGDSYLFNLNECENESAAKIFLCLDLKRVATRCSTNEALKLIINHNKNS